MAATTTRPMTVDEFRRLPEDNGPFYHELRHGELVSVTRPKFKHHLIQSRIRDLLKPLAEPGAFLEYRGALENGILRTLSG